jgi:phytoene synthase
VIGLQMVEILGMKKGEEENTRKAAEKLGIAFQLANFIRDVGEDLERGRIYLPMDELAAFNIDREMLERKIVTPQLKLALKDQIERVRKLQSEANAGIKNLSPDSRPCIEAASELYCGIVDEVEKIDFQIFNKRAKTSTLRRIRVALPAWLRAVKAR